MTSRVVFMGTPEFAVPTLQALIDTPDFEVVGIVTQPDREAGRGKHLKASPVKLLALDHQLSIYQPEKLRGDEAINQLKGWDADFFVVAAYGQILRQNVLDLPRHGCINVHASLLPRWRGAAPIQYAILEGDEKSGITTMKMDIGLDTGDMLKKAEISILPSDTGQSLHDKLAALGGPLLVATLQALLSGTLIPQKQDDSLMTYAPRIEKEDGRIHWETSAVAIDRRVRAFTPWPGTFTFWQGQLLKIIAGKAYTPSSAKLAIGEVSTQLKDIPLAIGTGEGIYVPQALQLEGRKVMEVHDFLHGNAQIHGAILG